MVALPNFNPVEGLISDIAGALTIFGQLRQLVTQTAAGSGLTPTSGQSVVGAAVWTYSGITIPTGRSVVAVAAGSNAAAGTFFAIGYGTAGAVLTQLSAGGAPSHYISAGQPKGVGYGTNNSVWVFSALAATVNWVVWTN